MNVLNNTMKYLNAKKILITLSFLILNCQNFGGDIIVTEAECKKYFRKWTRNILLYCIACTDPVTNRINNFSSQTCIIAGMIYLDQAGELLKKMPESCWANQD